MLKTLVAMIAAVVIPAPLAVAEVVEIPLPDLLGTYPISESNVTRTATFQLPTVPLVVHGVSFRISGTATVGTVTCESGGPYPWTMDMGAIMVDAPSTHSWYTLASMPDAAGPFGWTAQFQTFSGATWGFLMDGEAEIDMYGVPMALVGLCLPTSDPPTANVTEAVLIVDAEFVVSVEETTWGHIKALYR